MKNILFIIDSLGIGGAEKALVSQAKEFYKKKYNIYCISIYNHILLEIPEFINLSILDWKNYKFFKYYRNSQRLYTIIESYDIKFDMILVHLDKSIALMKNYSHINKYNIIHNTLSEQNFTATNFFRRRRQKNKTKKLYNGLKLITVSDGIKQDIEEIGIKPKSLQRIYNSIDFNEIFIKSEEKQEEVFDDCIVCVGRLVKQKRHDILLKAFQKSKLSVKLILVGDGEEKNNINKLIEELDIKERVVLLGFKQNPYPIIKNAKLFVLSSQYEGFGIVLVESLFLDTPVISTDCKSGPNEILTDNLSEYLVEVNNIDQLSQKMIEVYNEPYKITTSVLDSYNQETITKLYLGLIK